MKFLFCEACHDLVRAISGARSEPRFCMCKRHAIWALDDAFDVVRVFDRQGQGGVPDKPAAYVVLISNSLLRMDGPMLPSTSAALLAAQGNNWFKACASLVVRVRPGEHPKTAWSDLPADDPYCWGTGRTKTSRVLAGQTQGRQLDLARTGGKEPGQDDEAHRVVDEAPLPVWRRLFQAVTRSATGG